jgi:uncharacterized protein YkwD
MLKYINEERAKAGVAPLTFDDRANNGAYAKSKDMGVINYFSHTSPTYGSPFTQMKQWGINYKAAGENIAKVGDGSSVILRTHQAFMNSQGHRENILNPNYKKLGLGFYRMNGYLYTTQWFFAE